MRAIILRSIVVIGAGVIVLAGVLFLASTVDGRPPTVLVVALTQPLADEPNRALITTSVEVTFSEPVETDAAGAISFEPSVPGGASWSGSTLIFTPASPLDLETEYTLTVGAGIRDLAGNEMAEAPPPFVFETAGRPSVVDTLPLDGADDVLLGDVIAVTFASLMDTASVEAELQLRPGFAHELRWSGELLEVVPDEPLSADSRYQVTIGAAASDVAGVTIGEPITFGFRTVAPGLRAETLVPADEVDGIAPATSIAVIFDRPVDPASFDDDMLRITPDVAGTFELVALPHDSSARRVLRFTPSGPLPVNTTFELELAPGLLSATGGALAEPVTWSFTTGAPPATVSNQLTFISDRAGIPNVWATNADGSGTRQLSAELSPVLDYAVSPDGTSLVVGDGRNLIFLRADGAARRVITPDGSADFDPTYAPDALRVAFARADVASGEGRGLWQWEVGGGEPTQIELPSDLLASPSSDDDEADERLRAPRYAPDGQAIAFVDADRGIGIVELPAQRLTLIDVAAMAPPAWLPDSTAILVTRGDPWRVPFEAPVAPMRAGAESEVLVVYRSGTGSEPSGFGSGARLAAVAPDGRVAYLDSDGTLRVADDARTAGRVPPALAGARIGAAAFAPSVDAMIIIVIGGDDPIDGAGQVVLFEPASGERTVLARHGLRPRWLP